MTEWRTGKPDTDNWGDYLTSIKLNSGFQYVTLTYWSGKHWVDYDENGIPCVFDNQVMAWMPLPDVYHPPETIPRPF